MLFILMTDFVRSRKGVIMELVRSLPFVAGCRNIKGGGLYYDND